MTREFFPYDPLRVRLANLLVGILGLAVAAWAAAAAVGDAAPRGWIRTGLSLGLALAALWLSFKLRPREGWGVRVGPLSLDIARVVNGKAEVPWSEVKRLERRGKQRERLVVVLSDQRCLTVAARLFRRRADFEAVALAIEGRLPPGKDH